jgi:hypothetical protein
MKALIPFLILVFSLAALAGENPKSSTPSSEVILKIQVFKTGRVRADGAELNSADLGKKLDALKEKRGMV